MLSRRASSRIWRKSRRGRLSQAGISGVGTCMSEKPYLRWTAPESISPAEVTRRLARTGAERPREPGEVVSDESGRTSAAAPRPRSGSVARTSAASSRDRRPGGEGSGCSVRIGIDGIRRSQRSPLPRWSRGSVRRGLDTTAVGSVGWDGIALLVGELAPQAPTPTRTAYGGDQAIDHGSSDPICGDAITGSAGSARSMGHGIVRVWPRSEPMINTPTPRSRDERPTVRSCARPAIGRRA